MSRLCGTANACIGGESVERGRHRKNNVKRGASRGESASRGAGRNKQGVQRESRSGFAKLPGNTKLTSNGGGSGSLSSSGVESNERSVAVDASHNFHLQGNSCWREGGKYFLRSINTFEEPTLKKIRHALRPKVLKRGSALRLPSVQYAILASSTSEYDKTENLRKCLRLLERCLECGEDEVLDDINPYAFLSTAREARAVNEAEKFVKILPGPGRRDYCNLAAVYSMVGDVEGAFKAARDAEKDGHTLDAIFYTTLISACARIRDSEKAFGTIS